MGCSSNGGEETNYSSVRISFDAINIELSLNSVQTIVPTIEGAKLDDFEVSASSDAVEVSLGDGVVIVRANKEGQAVVTLKHKKANISDSFLVYVLEGTDLADYELEINLENTKIKYLLNETFDLSGLEIYAYETHDGTKDENSKIYVSNYEVEVEGGTNLNSLGRRKVHIKTELFGETSFDIEVVNEITESSLSINTINAPIKFKKGTTFSSSGLEVYENSIVYSLDNEGNRISREERKAVTDYKLNYSVQDVLSESGIYEVIVSKDGLDDVSYEIYVERDDAEFKTLAHDSINTRDIALEINSSIPSPVSYFGEHYILKFKPNYLAKINYKKSLSLDESLEEVTSKEGMLIDKNKNIFSFSVNGENVVAEDLIKTNTTSIWDYLKYGGYASFKEFNENDFPLVSYSDSEGYYKEVVNPVEGTDNYLTSLASYPVVKGAMEIANIDKGIFKYCKEYKVTHSEGKLGIRLYFKGLGEVSVKVLDSTSNTDEEIISKAQKENDFVVSKDVVAPMKEAISAINKNNYSVNGSYGTTYYHPKYIYSYYEPIAILAGLKSSGYVSYKDPNSEYGGAGIYYFEANDGGDNVITSVRTDTVQSVYLDTAQIKYSELFVSALGNNYLSNEFKDIFEKDDVMATFEEVSGTTLYLSKNADVSEVFLKHFGGSDPSTLKESGYIYGGFQLQYDASEICGINLFLVDDNLYGYTQAIENIGHVEIKAIEDYFNL